MQVDGHEVNARLDWITTRWTTVVYPALGPEGDGKHHALARLAAVYEGPVYLYLRDVLRDPDVADDLNQEFWLRVARGYFRGASRRRGRFRDYVRRALERLVLTHFRKAGRRKRTARPLGVGTDDPAVVREPPGEFFDEAFRARLRGRLLERAKEALGKARPKGKAVPLIDVVEALLAHREWESGRFAEYFTKKRGHRMTAAAFRKRKQFASKEFARLLVEEVIHSLGVEEPSYDQVEGELIGLELLPICKEALDLRFGGQGG
jgi:DNA-directed RNA polymerase specialized sigma24 family protein